MKLFVAKRHIDYEGFDILGIFSNKDLAQATCEKDEVERSGDSYSVEELTLDVDYT